MAKLLIVDDYEPDRVMMSMIAEAAGHICIQAESSIGILDLLEKHLPDAIFIDLVMPEKEGIESILQIKAHFPQIPVIVVSGMSYEYINIAKRLGADEGISKNELDSKLPQVIEHFCQ